VPGGSADIVINDSDATHSHTVDCTRIGSTTLITVSENDTSLRISVNNRHELDVEYVDMNDVDGFTGSYLEDLQGKAGVLLTDQTYRLSGTAEGFYAAHPAARTTARFDIRFAC
jgi:lipoprotein LpqH